ncbi:MCE family protein, partial [Escherichia coli]|nr:MCE family protein [Escherichia coli]
GEVITVRPRANAFHIDLYIKPAYRNPLTINSVFWALCREYPQLIGSGLSAQASTLSRSLKGPIIFDHLSCASASQRKVEYRLLHAPATPALAVCGVATLLALNHGNRAGGAANWLLGVLIAHNHDRRF